jgi:hypothetical protein
LDVTVCTDASYHGVCKTFSVDAQQAHHYVQSLSPFGLNDNISSLLVGSKVRLHAFLDDNFSAIRGWRSTADIAINAYIPDPSLVSGGGMATYDIGDNPIDIATIRDHSGTAYASQATYEPGARIASHAQLGPNVGDLVSSLILDNLDVLGDTEPLASTFKGNYPGSTDGHTFWTDGNDGLCHNHDYWFIAQTQTNTKDWTDNTIPEVSSCVEKIGRIWRCPLDCDLNTSPVRDDSFLGGYYLDPNTHAPVLGPGGSCSSCISKSLYDYSVEWLAADPSQSDKAGSVFGGYNHFGDPDRATVNGTDYVLVPVETCVHDVNHPNYILVLDVGLNFVGRWFFPNTPPVVIDPKELSAAWVAVRPGTNEIWTSYSDYLLNAANRAPNPSDPSTWLSFYSTDDPDWSKNHVQNGLLIFDPQIWNNPRGNDPTGIQNLVLKSTPPVITGLRGYPVSLMTAQGGVFSPSGKVLYLAAGYTGDESFSGSIEDGICYSTDWFSDCMKPNDYGVVTAIDADTYSVLETSGNNVGPFNYQIANDENTNEPEGLDFFDTACYAADVGRPPAGFGLTQLHAMVNNDQLQGWSGVYLKHYTGNGLGSQCDSGFGSDPQKVKAVLSGAGGGGFCVSQQGSNVLVCSDLESADQTAWSAALGGAAAWAIRVDSAKTGSDATVLVETANDNSWHDQIVCDLPSAILDGGTSVTLDGGASSIVDGGSSGLPAIRTIAASVKLSTANPIPSENQGAAVYGLYQEDTGNAYYASLRSDGTITLGKRFGGAGSTIATATVSAPAKVWHVLSLRVSPTTDTLHPPAGGLWATVSYDNVQVIDQLADSVLLASNRPCSGLGTFGTQAAFDDYRITAP